MILLISTSQVAGITGAGNCSQPEFLFLIDALESK
jgi:hypothetical protein